MGYLHDKFPNESEASIQEAAAYISNRTAIVVQDLNAELGREWEKTYRQILCRYSGSSSDDFKKLSEQLVVLEKVTGYSLGDLISKLAAGWTLDLKPPKGGCSMGDLAKKLKEFMD